MKYFSLYRKYRPQNFSEIKGQEVINRALKNSIANNSFSHAYLFSGSRGTGKTTTAKVFAKAINCLNISGERPCNECKICKGIANNTIPDIIEFDAASNKGINEIREIISNVNLMPFKAKYKVYIIDEIHMLSIPAFNALLKTLEDPPEHVIFIFATTEYNKVPATIVSRCQQYLFKLISVPQIESSIIDILKLQNIKYEKEAVREVALLAKGSLRDALSILEQLIMFCDKDTLTNEVVYKIFSLISYDEKTNFIYSILLNKTEKIFIEASNFKKANISFDKLTMDIITILKEILEYKITKNNDFLQINSEIFAKKIIKEFSFVKIEKILSIFIEFFLLIKNSNTPDIYFELATLKCLEFLSVIDEDVKKSNKTFKVENQISRTDKTDKQIFDKREIKNPNLPTKPNNNSSISSKLTENQPIINKTNAHKELNLKQELPKDNIELRNYMQSQVNIFDMPEIPMDMNLIFKTIIQANGQLRKRSSEILDGFFENKFNDKNKLISLYNMPIKAASNNYLIIVTPLESSVKWIYSQLATSYAEQTLTKIFNQPTAIIPVSIKEWANIGIEYRKLQQAGKLPSPINIPPVSVYFENIRNYFPQDVLISENSKETSNFKTGKMIFDNYEVVEE